MKAAMFYFNLESSQQSRCRVPISEPYLLKGSHTVVGSADCPSVATTPWRSSRFQGSRMTQRYKRLANAVSNEPTTEPLDVNGNRRVGTRKANAALTFSAADKPDEAPVILLPNDRKLGIRQRSRPSVWGSQASEAIGVVDIKKQTKTKQINKKKQTYLLTSKNSTPLVHGQCLVLQLKLIQVNPCNTRHNLRSRAALFSVRKQPRFPSLIKPLLISIQRRDMRNKALFPGRI